MRDEKLHAFVARITFRSQNKRLNHFWKLRWWKSAHRYCAKHISKSKCTKHINVGALLEVEMSRKCTPLWREAHFQVKTCKAHQHRSTFGSWHVEKVHAIVARSMARSTFPSQNLQNTPSAFLEVDMLKNSTLLWREAHVQVKSAKNWRVRSTFGCSDVASGARDCAPCQKWAKREGFVEFPKTMAGVGRLKRICKDAFSAAGAVQETCSSEMLAGPGAHFLRGVAFCSMRSSVLGRWFGVADAALCMTWHHFFVAVAIL